MEGDCLRDRVRKPIEYKAIHTVRVRNPFSNKVDHSAVGNALGVAAHTDTLAATKPLNFFIWAAVAPARTPFLVDELKIHHWSERDKIHSPTIV
jgi:hypothetical protein